MSNNKVLASIIIPVYNTEQYIDRCLDSVTNIKNGDIEIIIVDDGSTDNSSALYGKYAGTDKRVSIIKKENRGVSSARNTGIQAAKGQWITFVDSDDEIVPRVYDLVLTRINSSADLWIVGTALCYSKKFDSPRDLVQGL